MDLKRIADEAKNGVVETHYGNGQLIESATYKDGKLEGLRENWYENGKLNSRVTYKDGKLNGLYETWYDNGQQLLRANYKDDKLNGLREEWHRNGNIKLIANYNGGKRDGVFETWHRNGQLWISAIYKDGVVEYIPNKHEQGMVEQESNKNVNEEELLRLCRENLAMKIMVLRDKQIAREITLKESLKQSVGLIEEYDKYKIENQL